MRDRFTITRTWSSLLAFQYPEAWEVEDGTNGARVDVLRPDPQS
jgi:hypothetical protein